MATPKQTSYALALMGKAGMDTRHLSSRHSAALPRDIAPTSRDVAKFRTVEAWIASLSTAQASQLISWLQDKAGSKAG